MVASLAEKIEVVMNKSELVVKLAQAEGVSEATAEYAVSSVIGCIVDGLVRGDRVELRGFGNFRVKKYDAYTGHNPLTHEAIQVEPKRLPCFKPGKNLKTRVNGGKAVVEEMEDYPAHAIKSVLRS
jgi:integration host factor subunit beta